MAMKVKKQLKSKSYSKQRHQSNSSWKPSWEKKYEEKDNNFVKKKVNTETFFKNKG